MKWYTSAGDFFVIVMYQPLVFQLFAKAVYPFHRFQTGIYIYMDENVD